MEDVNLILKYTETNEVTAEASWRTEDIESEIKFCSCLLGKFLDVISLNEGQYAYII